MSICNYHSKQKGTALFITLVFLVIITLLSLSAMNSSVMEQKMSANFQYNLEAFETAQSVVDSTLESSGSFKVTEDIDDSHCHNIDNCDDTYNLDGDFTGNINGDASIASKLKGIITRTDAGSVPVPRGIDTSADKFNAAMFEVMGTYDDTANGYGQSTIVQGNLVLVPKSGQ